MLAQASKYQISPSNINIPSGTASRRSEPMMWISEPKGYRTSSTSTPTPSKAMPVCRKRCRRRARARTAQAKPSGNPTLNTMRVRIRSVEAGGRNALNTSIAAAAMATRASRNNDAGNCAGVRLQRAMSQNAFTSRSIVRSVIIDSKLYTRINGMPDAIWIDRDDELPALARTLESQAWIGLDTEFLRERTFFPKLCLLQLAAGAQIWCVDTLRIGSLDPLMPVLTEHASRKVIHAARQDLEAVYLTTRRVMTPVFDTQIAAGCIGLKPQAGYAELVKTLLDVSIPKGQTRTDWSKRPLSREQLEYAADDVLYLGDISAHLAA